MILNGPRDGALLISETTMAWRKETPKRRIMRLVRLAYKEAEIGNSENARSLWETAKSAGYEPEDKGRKGFEIAIKKGLRETRT